MSVSYLPIYLSPFPPHDSKFTFYICDSIPVLWIASFVPLFKIPHISAIT